MMRTSKTHLASNHYVVRVNSGPGSHEHQDKVTLQALLADTRHTLQHPATDTCQTQQQQQQQQQQKSGHTSSSVPDDQGSLQYQGCNQAAALSGGELLFESCPIAIQQSRVANSCCVEDTTFDLTLLTVVAFMP
jgi:hypothetical protein